MGKSWGRKGFGFWRAGEVGARKARAEPEIKDSGEAGSQKQTRLRSNKIVRFEEDGVRRKNEEKQS